MKKSQVCGLIRAIGIIPAIRVSSGEDAHFAAEAVTRGGIPIVEITMTVPGAVELISHLVRHHPEMLVGAGTVLDTETARLCVDAGANFLTAPGFDVELVEFAAKENVTVLPGALTPTEVITAWKAGSDFVKVFPCAQVGGDKYIKALNRSLPQIPLVAAGGVNQQTALNFILSGATAIGVGTELIPTEAIERRQSDRIGELALRFTGFVREARERLEKARKKSAAARKYMGTEECESQ
ncbi:MAG TPA: bifunctional 4-hydroxy-2-oxoglutarate aldolase/2-dehydro-3-deoxy-phosphogluconate aldolase [Terriglobia bacterium]|nr:bifunctional 4-hydroxy-2-oxoglutarate aldolase/2-dehydro-3-deoxy-phosphogluconate aldolase [Terriglobia bacterium]